MGYFQLCNTISFTPLIIRFFIGFFKQRNKKQQKKTHQNFCTFKSMKCWPYQIGREKWKTKVGISEVIFRYFKQKCLLCCALHAVRTSGSSQYFSISSPCTASVMLYVYKVVIFSAHKHRTLSFSLDSRNLENSTEIVPDCNKHATLTFVFSNQKVVLHC